MKYSNNKSVLCIVLDGLGLNYAYFINEFIREFAGILIGLTVAVYL